MTSVFPWRLSPARRLAPAWPLVCCMAAVLLLGGCEGTTSGKVESGERDTGPVFGERKKESIFGEGGLTLFGGDKKNRHEEDGGGGIGVNSFLWRATLDTVSFLPMSSADPFGGVVITDWYSPAASPSERLKLNIYILSRALRADGVRVAVFRQVQDSTGTWRDAQVPEQVGVDVEDAILTKARQLRNETLLQ